MSGSPIIVLGGSLPDPPDPRDRLFDLVRTGFERVARAGVELFLPIRTPISGQDKQDCTANAGCDSFEIVDEEDPPRQYSRRFNYWHARRLHNDENVDGGTYNRASFQVQSKIGSCLESTYPYTEEVNRRPTLLAEQEAYDNRLEDYYAIRTTGAERLDDCETAIRAGKPFVFAADIGQPFVDYRSADVKWNPPQRPIGRHALMGVGVFRNADGVRRFLGRNSWTINWGMAHPLYTRDTTFTDVEQRRACLGGGYFWISEEWLADPFTNDIWVPNKARKRA